MPTAGRYVIILLLFGAVAHIFLGGGLSFISDYRIWRPIVESSGQEIILVHDINSKGGRNFTGILSNDERKFYLTGAAPIDNSINISSKFYNPSTNGSLSNELANVYSTIDKLIVTDSISKPTETRTKNINSSKTDVSSTALNTIAGPQSARQLFDNETLPAYEVTPGMQMVRQNSSLAECPVIPPGLVGPIKVWYDEPTFDEIERLNPHLEPGGHGKSKSCLSRHRVAIIIPYRDREAHLRILLHNLHSLLTKQQLDYAIFVVEQHENETFNRGKLMNVGYVEAIKLYDWQCFVFHDVDLLAEDDRNIYSCPDQPRHMSVAINKFQYKLPYGSLFGGICAMRTEQFVKVNGFSNSYWGWGGEDDDLSMRVTSAGYKIMRYPPEIGRYQMIAHKSEKKNPINKCRFDLLARTLARQKTDGISSLKYECYDVRFLRLFTHIKVRLLEQESREQLRKKGLTKC
uniref:Beta-1,4-N-acetylgalactosaminyltransferase n=1 Tax=Elaeophora elaphi TaxID=1147741 RepID=A0A0R3RJQ2_9BILA